MRIIIKNLQTRIPISRRAITLAIRNILTREAAPSNGEINVSYITDAAITLLNRRYHRRGVPTDVLAFDLAPKKDRIIADIYISADTAAANARVFRSRLSDELRRYAIHGVLHILGYRDRTAAQRRIMRRKEQYYLRRLQATSDKQQATSLTG